MAEEGKGVALAILGIVAVIAVVGLVLLFTGATGKVASSYGDAKVYGGGEIAHGLDQYRDPEGYVRYQTPRPYEFEEGVWPERLMDSGENEPPAPVYGQDYKRTGPVLDNPCPYPPYTDKTTGLYAEGRDCVPSESPGYEDFLCCV
jgi:hypothetical protein